MMRLVQSRLTWDESDVLVMSHCIGADAAVTQHAPLNVALLKLAERKHMQLDDACRHALAFAIRQREILASNDYLSAPYHSTLEQSMMPHQRAALRFFDTRLPSYLVADDTGVGKTLQALMWARQSIQAQRTLIITPNGAKQQWADAIWRWIGTRESVSIVEGTIAQQQHIVNFHNSLWMIGHWESLVHAQAEYQRKQWDAIILDEAQYITNRKAQRSEIVYRLHAPHRMALTADPFSNDPGELYAILRFLYPATYRSYWRFFNMHVRAVPKPFGGMEVLGAKRPKLLRWELAPFTLHRTKAQVYPHLPPVATVRRTVELTHRGVREYEQLKRKVFAELDALGGGEKFVPIINQLARLTRLRQYVVDPGLIGGRERSQKYQAVLALLKEFNGPPVIFTAFRQAAIRLGALCEKQKLHVGYIHGEVSMAMREVTKHAFLKGQLDALLVVMKAGGTALNLGKYGLVIHLDLPWTPREFKQTVGRVDRPTEGSGTLVPTTDYRIIMRGTYEEKLEQRLLQRDKVFHEVFTIGRLKELFDAESSPRI